MPLTPRPKLQEALSDTDTPFDVTLVTPATAEDFVTVPGGKKGRIISLVNEGPGVVAIKADATAVVTDTLLFEGDAYSESRLDVATKFSFINVTPGESPRIRGVLWSGD